MAESYTELQKTISSVPKTTLAEAAALEEKITQEDGYKYLLEDFNKAYQETQKIDQLRIERADSSISENELEDKRKTSLKTIRISQNRCKPQCKENWNDHR